MKKFDLKARITEVPVHKAKKISAGHYEYRGYCIARPEGDSHAAWGFCPVEDDYAEDFRDTLAEAKKAVDRLVG